MRFYTTQHPFYCGIDLHARTMYLCILDQGGERTSIRVWCSHVWSAPLYGNQVRTRHRLLTTPGTQRRKKTQKTVFRSSLFFDKRGFYMGSALHASRSEALPPWAAPRSTHVPCSRARGYRQSNPGGAYRGNCGKSSVIANQGAFSCAPQKM